MELLNQKKIIFICVAVAAFFIICFLVVKIERRIERQNIKAPEVKVTIPEGSKISDIINIVSVKLPNFNKKNFLLDAENKEGYLFPDTYFLFFSDDGSKAIQAMSDNFNIKIAPILPEINLSGHSEKDIITMASIIEREASGDKDRNIISGILWKRLSKGMLLEVDAAPDTYKKAGLPTNPICNPGLAAIEAAIHPESSPYLFYLHDKKGIVHYAQTFEEHQQNELIYLK